MRVVADVGGAIRRVSALHGLAVAVATQEIHARVRPGRIALQHALVNQNIKPA